MWRSKHRTTNSKRRRSTRHATHATRAVPWWGTGDAGLRPVARAIASRSRRAFRRAARLAALRRFRRSSLASLAATSRSCTSISSRSRRSNLSAKDRKVRCNTLAGGGGALVRKGDSVWMADTNIPSQTPAHRFCSSMRLASSRCSAAAFSRRIRSCVLARAACTSATRTKRDGKAATMYKCTTGFATHAIRGW